VQRSLRKLIEDQLVNIIIDPESIVKQTLLASNLTQLCICLGPKLGMFLCF
jgi:hypothetical protein